IVIEAFVAEQCADLYPVEEGCDAGAVMPLPRQQHKAGKVAETIDQGDDLGRQAAARASDGLILSPPFAPVPCWWTRMTVPSTIAYSKSGSPDNVAKRPSNTFFRDHRRKAMNFEFQFPRCSGRSRQGAATGAIQRPRL